MIEAYLTSALMSRHADTERKKSTTETKMSSDAQALSGIIMLLFFAALVLAVLDAKRARETSLTQSADVIFAVCSPLTYWILNFMGLLGDSSLMK